MVGVSWVGFGWFGLRVVGFGWVGLGAVNLGEVGFGWLRMRHCNNCLSFRVFSKQLPHIWGGGLPGFQLGPHRSPFEYMQQMPFFAKFVGFSRLLLLEHPDLRGAQLQHVRRVAIESTSRSSLRIGIGSSCCAKVAMEITLVSG